MEEQIGQITQRVQNIETWMRQSETSQADLLEKLGRYEQAQTEWKDGLVNAISQEVGKVVGSLDQLYNNVKHQVDMFEARIAKMEQATRQPKEKTLLHTKDIKPSELSKDDQWRRWKSDIEDYTEEVFPGMKEMLERVRNADGTVDEEWFDGSKAIWWDRGDMLWRFLKRYTGTDARRIVLGVSEDNGWEAWRKLHQQYEPATITREAHVLSRYTSMVTKKAKTPRETKTLLIELNERAKRVEEVTGKPVEDRHAMSVIAGLLDPETAKHTAQYQGAKADVEVLKRKVMEFINLITAHDNNRMDLDRLQHEVFEQEDAAWDSDMWAETQTQEEQVNAFGEKCHSCGGVGHYARECPSKGKGKGGGPKGKGGGGGGFKGKGGGGPKGDGRGLKGKGKGVKGKGNGSAPQFGSCWNCGGSHFARDCTQSAGKGGAKGEVRVLASLRAATGEQGSANIAKTAPAKPALTTRNRYQVLGALQEEEEEPQEVKDNIGRDGPGVTHGLRQGVACDKLQRGSGGPRTKVGRAQEELPKGRWRGPTQVLGSLVEVVPEGVNSVGESEWEEIEMAVDSGATETVIGKDMLGQVQLKEGSAYRRGVHYEVASGELIPNLGEKQFVGYNEGGQARSMTAQVCDVNKALLSVKKMVQAGNRVVFEPEGGYVEDMASGERLHLREQAGMYMLKLWVKSPFHGQAD